MFVLLACVLLPIRYAFMAWFPDGIVKRILLLHLWDDPGSPKAREQRPQSGA